MPLLRDIDYNVSMPKIFPSLVSGTAVDETFLDNEWIEVHREIVPDHSILNAVYTPSRTSTLKTGSVVNKQFIGCIKQFNREFKTSSEFDKAEYQAISNELKISLSALVEIEPDNISLELTSDKSAYYTIQKGNSTFFFQHFLKIESSDEDEAIVTKFENGEYQSSYAGNLDDAISEFCQHIKPLPQNTVNVFDLVEVPM
jgi:hypothetical protein